MNKMLKLKILKIKELCEFASLNESGKVYLDALNKAVEQFGEDGLKDQVMYILANGKWYNKLARKKLEKYSKTGILE